MPESKLFPQRITTLLFRRIGDTLMATPALRAVKQRYEDAYLQAIVEPQTARVLENNPWIDEVIEVPASPSAFRLRKAIIAKGVPDITLDFLSDPRSAVACFLSRAPRRIGFAGRGRSWAYTDQIAPQVTSRPVYSVNHKAAFADAIDANTADLSTDFYLEPEDHEFAQREWRSRGWSENRSVAAFFVHSRRSYKRWPLQNFVAIIRQLQNLDLAVPLLLNTPGDENAVAELSANCSLAPEHIINIDDLGRLGAVLKNCRVLVGNDGGPKHIAVALDVCTITVFGAESPIYWTPPNDNKHMAFIFDFQNAREAHFATPEAVISAIERIMAAS